MEIRFPLKKIPHTGFVFNKTSLLSILVCFFCSELSARSWKVSELNIKIDKSWIPGDFHDGAATVDVFDAEKSEYRRGYINMGGEWIVEPKFMPFKRTGSLDINGDFHDGMALVLLNTDKQKDAWSYMDLSGKMLSDTFGGALPFQNGYAVVINNEKHGHINKKGEYFDNKTIIRHNPKSNGYKIFRTKKYRSRCGYINPVIHDTIPPRYLNCGKFHNGLAKVNDDKGWHFINSAGRKVVIEKKGFNIDHFENGFAVITNLKSKKMGLVDRWGRSVLPVEFEYVGDVSDNMIVLTKKNGIYKYMEITGGR